MQVAPLFNETAAQTGANLEVLIEAKDLTQTTPATAQTLNLFKTVAPFTSIQLVRAELIEPFADPADTASNSTTVTVGDAGSANRYLAATQVNANAATPVRNAPGVTATYVPAADSIVTATISAPPAGKTLAALTKGRLRLLFRRIDSRDAA